MIFASVGTMLGFDRFTRAVDHWAGKNPNIETFLQIGDGSFKPINCEWARLLTPADYDRQLSRCNLFAAHAGMGSILQGLGAGKPMVLLPRRAELGEHTTNHQWHTADHFGTFSGIHIANDEAELQELISEVETLSCNKPSSISDFAPREFTNRINRYLKDHSDLTSPNFHRR